MLRGLRDYNQTPADSGSPIAVKDAPAAIDLDLYEAVFAALAGHRPGALVSTSTAVADARKRLPAASTLSDEDLIDMIVKVATANEMLISFDSKV